MKNNIKAIREGKGITQAELARRLKLSRSYLNRIENGKQNPTLPLAIRIANVLETTLNDIFL